MSVSLEIQSIMTKLVLVAVAVGCPIPNETLLPSSCDVSCCFHANSDLTLLSTCSINSKMVSRDAGCTLTVAWAVLRGAWWMQLPGRRCTGRWPANLPMDRMGAFSSFSLSFSCLRLSFSLLWGWTPALPRQMLGGATQSVGLISMGSMSINCILTLSCRC